MVQLRQEDELIQLVCGLTTLSNDLRKATQVEIDSNNRLITRIAGVDYCWYIKKGRLIRGSGTYDTSTQEFSYSAQSLLATGITACSYVCEQQLGRVVGLWCTLSGTRHSMLLYASVGAFNE
jgi:hypothetical protein